MSYAKDGTYIYIYHTKLIKKQKQAFKIEKHTIIGPILDDRLKEKILKP